MCAIKKSEQHLYFSCPLNTCNDLYFVILIFVFLKYFFVSSLRFIPFSCVCYVSTISHRPSVMHNTEHIVCVCVKDPFILYVCWINSWIPQRVRCVHLSIKRARNAFKIFIVFACVMRCDAICSG